MSINNKRSYTEYTVTQPTTDFAIGFDDFDEGGKDNILVTLNGVLVESLGYAAIRKNESTVSITPAITEGTVRLTRETDIDEPFHKFTAGALFSAKSMDENFQQVRHSQQEVRDGFVFLEYNTNGIVQASKEATAQAKAATVEATASAVRAESAADTAVQAVGSLQGVVNAATTATTNANTATATATTAASQATAATTTAQNAASAATVAKQEATAATANAMAATVDTLAATGRANEAADVVADLVVGKVRAQDVSTADGSTQAEVNKKTVYEYDTVATMLADTSISVGKVVSTNGYYSKRDGGGAKYEISSTATNYSIPLVNGLHAVFNDTFDIRKFGIVDSKTKDQDAELARMRNYADTREYVIDFHNFWIRAPKENYPYMGTGNYLGTVRGLWFEQAHKYKNLKITHDKTVRLNTGEHLLVFAPVTNPDVETWVVFENVTLDAWCDNNQPFTEDYIGYYDGQRHGIFCHPRHKSMGGEITNWADQTNYSFKFKHIHFESPAYSYSITTSAVCARQNIIENVTGTYVGLLYNFQALDVIAKDILVHRDRTKMEAERLMVGTILHHEPELGNMSRDFNKYSFENVRGTISGGSSPQLFKLSPIGNGQTFKEIEIVDCDGEVILEGDNGTVHKFTRSGGEGTNSFYKTTVGTANITDFTIKAFPFSWEFGIPATLLTGNTTITTLNIERCVVIDPLTWGDDAVGNITNLNITDSTINHAGYAELPLINSYDVKVDHVTLTRVITDVRALLKCESKTVNINDILVRGTITDYMDFKVGAFCNLYCYDVKYAAVQTEGTYFTKGDHYVRYYGGVEVQDKITATSTSPYFVIEKHGISSPASTVETVIPAQTLATAGTIKLTLTNALNTYVKSYTVKTKRYIAGLGITHSAGGNTIEVVLTNTTVEPIIINATDKLVLTQVM